MSGAADVPEVNALAADELASGGAVVLDVREADEFAAGHVRDARHVPLGELGEHLAELPEGVIVCVCRSGARSAVAVAALRGAGRDARNLSGGLLAWVGDGLPLVRADGGAGAVR